MRCKTSKVVIMEGLLNGNKAGSLVERGFRNTAFIKFSKNKTASYASLNVYVYTK